MPLSGATRRGRAIAAYRTGATGPEIAAVLGVDPSTVRRWVHQLDAARRTGPRGRTGVPTNRIITLRDVEGLSFADIAAAVRMTKSGVIHRYRIATEGHRRDRWQAARPGPGGR
ncbi:MAG: helix-turn-helix domain-containing protein [Pseudonocardiaceae bacterium]